jgi:pyridoxal phosphate enzyme (YggS family)
VPDTIPGRLAEVRARIARAASRAGRDPSSVRLVAVSKTFSADHVRAAAAAGQIDFGENKVQEALAKMDALADLPLRWHLIGHLQSNKAKRAGSRFDVVQSVDSAALLKKIDEGAAAEHRTVDLFVQVDLAREATKFGARPTELTEILAATQQAANVRVVGLMLIPPAVDDPEDARRYFRELRQLRDGLATSGRSAEMVTELSMGMSHDFEVAVEEGATVVRVGSAIFGARTYP